jgi:hypothetical protein
VRPDRQLAQHVRHRCRRGPQGPVDSRARRLIGARGFGEAASPSRTSITASLREAARALGARRPGLRLVPPAARGFSPGPRVAPCHGFPACGAAGSSSFASPRVSPPVGGSFSGPTFLVRGFLASRGSEQPEVAWLVGSLPCRRCTRQRQPVVLMLDQQPLHQDRVLGQPGSGRQPGQHAVSPGDPGHVAPGGCPVLVLQDEVDLSALGFKPATVAPPGRVASPRPERQTDGGEPAPQVVERPFLGPLVVNTEREPRPVFGQGARRGQRVKKEAQKSRVAPAWSSHIRLLPHPCFWSRS